MYLYMKKAQESRNQVVGPAQLISKCDFTFEAIDSARGILPGDTVQGTLAFALATGPPVKSIKLQVIGAERVNWYDEKEHSTNRFWSIECIGKTSASETGKYKFKFKLASKLPPSYTTKYGNITYWIEPVFGDALLGAISSSTRHEGKMSIKQRNDFLKKYRKTFKIQPNFDLSAYPRLHRHISVMKDNSGFFTSKNLIEVILSLPKLGYVPNETIEFSIHLINGSDKYITSSSLALIQEVKFHAGPVNQNDVKVLVEKDGPTMSTKCCRIWAGVIRIPPRVSPISIRCNFVRVEYYLRASVKSTGVLETVEVKVPIVIGTISTTGDMQSPTADDDMDPRKSSSPSLSSMASEITYCSHGYLDRSMCNDILPKFSSLSITGVSAKAKTDDDWETMSFSSLPFDDAMNTASTSSRAAALMKQ